jgi:hypothetical protein
LISDRPAGTTPPTLSCNCRLTGPVPLPFTPNSADHFVDAIGREYDLTILRYARASESV